MKIVKPFINNEFVGSNAPKHMDVHDPSTGAVIAQAPCCTEAEVRRAVEAARAAFPGWAGTPVIKRVQVLYRLRSLIERHFDELALLVATENGKVLEEAEGDVLKAKEAMEQAISAPSLMMGESLMDTSSGFDTVLYREPVGVFAGIAPFNFPAMIPMGWMTPMCVACGNTIVLKAASMTPLTSMRFAELYREAGLPPGVLNIVTCSRNEAEILLTHPDVDGISFVGSTSVGLHIYSAAAASGKRVQALCEAKNHALVLDDAPVERTARGIINSYLGCAGERCMALPVAVAQEGVADALVETLKRLSRERAVGPAYDRRSQLGPLVSAEQKGFVERCIAEGEAEGAQIVLDGRNIVVKGYEGGFYLGPTIFDRVTPEMRVGREEIFGPVLCVKRVKSFEEGLAVMNANPYANGSVIFTQNGYYAREFVRRTDGGMVGVNVGIPVPVGVFPFSGHKRSFFGDLHTLGKDGIRFYTKTKTVTTRWFDENELKAEKVGTWDGTI
jgi:malonate-semialdehyde dehydrogenase (acetylating)/methylmalonate-semialdehyde dehydrogenase